MLMAKTLCFSAQLGIAKSLVYVSRALSERAVWAALRDVEVDRTGARTMNDSVVNSSGQYVRAEKER
jgi:hypothetical protein|tara:strand:- start:8395 stop:8595 length:201 start_codon:yes stop_codon:yes gene_type:complete